MFSRRAHGPEVFEKQMHTLAFWGYCVIVVCVARKKTTVATQDWENIPSNASSRALFLW
ncbi:hypothetical protein ACRRTK_011801 [Alexandromys fortis]